MTARLLMSCDGLRDGRSCRGFWTGPAFTSPAGGWSFLSWLRARDGGWTHVGRPLDGPHRCPSGDHDDEKGVHSVDTLGGAKGVRTEHTLGGALGVAA